MEKKAVEEEIKKIIFKHLSPSDYQVFIFGSRAASNNRKWSDYDIGILGKEKIPAMVKFAIEEELEESGIPYVVEIVDFHDVSDKFKRVALQKIKLWSKPNF